ncbi:FAD/NAD-P-binding domain-containing protein [Lactarius akahatsu]|uniref:FAD/NAD-P-binding domain-containing protein n=1 Tax=Lactarius akahatsu TaxID=416441 RepID=A0AAD4QDV0_9AGAM|nr:FAD/NAD-P-binding domain-containing protein [Lactarius akahatsu]
MRNLISLILLTASLSHAIQLPFDISKLWPVKPPPSESLPVVETPQPPRIAIIGAGAGGSSAAFWIAKAKERSGLDVEIDIYERNDYIGGRSTTVYPYNDKAYEPVELGASIFVAVNKNLQRATREFNLSLYGFEDDDGDMGIWDGEQFLYTTGSKTGIFGSWLDNLKFLWRYGYRSAKRMQELVRSTLDVFVTLYNSDAPQWSSIEELKNALNWTELVSLTGAEYFLNHGVSQRLITELIEAGTRVNYAQNVDDLHSLVTACSLAADGGVSVKGGNWRIFEQFVKRSGARIFLGTEVVGIQRRSDNGWTVATQDGHRDYDAVIIAAPYHTSRISLPDDISSSIPPQPYIHLHVTLLTTTAATPDPEYFGYKPSGKIPTTILTSFDGARQGGKAPEFNSLTYHGQAKIARNETHDAQNTGEWSVKIFSMEPISDDWLARVFQGQVGWVFRKEWDSYPVLPPTVEFPPVKLDDGLFYVNAFEPLISAMETETIASRNIVELILKEKFNSSICPVETTRATTDGGVYGWDC